LFLMLFFYKSARGVDNRHKAGYHAENRSESIRSVNIKIGKSSDVKERKSKNRYSFAVELVHENASYAAESHKAGDAERHPEKKGNHNIKNA